jgi:hypothetical protein
MAEKIGFFAKCPMCGRPITLVYAATTLKGWLGTNGPLSFPCEHCQHEFEPSKEEIANLRRYVSEQLGEA